MMTISIGYSSIIRLQKGKAINKYDLINICIWHDVYFWTFDLLLYTLFGYLRMKGLSTCYWSKIIKRIHF